MWPGQYEVFTARYNYTRRDGTKFGTVHTLGQYKSRDDTYVGTVHDLVYCMAPAKINVITMVFTAGLKPHSLYM